jgi:hypothetical protein
VCLARSSQRSPVALPSISSLMPRQWPHRRAFERASPMPRRCWPRPSPTRSRSISTSTIAAPVGGAAADPDNGMFESYSSIRADRMNNATPGDTTFNALQSGSSIQGQSNIAVWNAQLKLWGFLSANDITTDDGSTTFATDINPNLLVGVRCKPGGSAISCHWPCPGAVPQPSSRSNWVGSAKLAKFGFVPPNWATDHGRFVEILRIIPRKGSNNGLST